MQIEEFTVDDSAVVEEVVRLARAARRPRLALEPPDDRRHRQSACSGTAGTARPRARSWRREETTGEVVGVARYWVSEWDNQDLAWLGPHVAPAHRRRGIATPAHRARCSTSPARPAAPRSAPTGGTRGARARLRGRHGLRAGARRRSAAAVPRRRRPGRPRASSATRRGLPPTDYELIRIVGRDAGGPDRRRGGDDRGDQRRADRRPRHRGRGLHRRAGPRLREGDRGEGAARLPPDRPAPRSTGELAGHTVVAVEEERPTIGHQHDTSVVRCAPRPPARPAAEGRHGAVAGRGREPQLRPSYTWNAESNDHMIPSTSCSATGCSGAGSGVPALALSRCRHQHPLTRSCGDHAPVPGAPAAAVVGFCAAGLYVVAWGTSSIGSQSSAGGRARGLHGRPDRHGRGRTPGAVRRVGARPRGDRGLGSPRCAPLVARAGPLRCWPGSLSPYQTPVLVWLVLTALLTAGWRWRFGPSEPSGRLSPGR